MTYLLIARAEITAKASKTVLWIDNTPEWFPRVEILAAQKSETADVTGPGDPDDDESDGGVGNIDPEDDEGYDDGDDDDDEEDTLWAVPAESSSPPNRA